MDSTLNPKPTGVIVRYFEQIAREDEQMARTPADDAARHPPAANNIQVPGDRPWFGRPAVRGFVGLLLAACIGVAAVAWQSYGDAAKPIIARWAPRFVLSSSLPLENPVPPAQQSPPVVQASAATAAPPQPATLAPTAAEGVAPTAAPESAQLLQPMARDVGHEIEQLKASIEQLKINQEQMTRDNARAAEQLNASQEQMAQVIAKASEQNLRPKISAPPPRPTATPTRKPVPIRPSPQARAQPQDTPQPQAEPQLPSAPRQPVR
ncbi:hypothetical protein SAMN05444159_0037 [Bradyrhizobium lablabi]|uniref:Uncharacterized protein n=1 Tax=Bradyrhizobium lablabi TaxID=722472 RepID=A0A1M6HL37_9BRAD|nr:hypothetical protein [Bradyrhizobium lablabi]SHJ22890.1 hypothetical protein SAMN05444159_0037 [Bradyrhizobium lablabi]